MIREEYIFAFANLEHKWGFHMDSNIEIIGGFTTMNKGSGNDLYCVVALCDDQTSISYGKKYMSVFSVSLKDYNEKIRDKATSGEKDQWKTNLRLR